MLQMIILLRIPLSYAIVINENSFMESQEKTVLIIEDEEDAAELFAEMMRVSGFRVVKTSSSAPAIAMMTAQKPDIVLLDIMMPEISGLDVLRQMRRDPALVNIPVVVVSAQSLPTDIRHGMEAGASTYLTKPVGFFDLKEAVERALGSQSTAARSHESPAHVHRSGNPPRTPADHSQRDCFFAQLNRIPRPLGAAWEYAFDLKVSWQHFTSQCRYPNPDDWRRSGLLPVIRDAGRRARLLSKPKAAARDLYRAPGSG